MYGAIFVGLFTLITLGVVGLQYLFADSLVPQAAESGTKSIVEDIQDLASAKVADLAAADDSLVH